MYDIHGYYHTHIVVIERLELPFYVVNIDIIGRIESTAVRSHQYVLTLADKHMRWSDDLQFIH